MIELAAYLLSGRLIIWLLQTNDLMRPVWQFRPLLTELGDCDLCLGFWVYLVLALFVQLPGVWPWYVEILILAAVASFTMHLVRLGWQTKFGVVIDD